MNVPLLKIAGAAPNVVLSWPSYDGDFGLESNANLTVPANWTPVAGTPVVVGNEYTVTNGTPGGDTFYRLKSK